MSDSLENTAGPSGSRRRRRSGSSSPSSPPGDRWLFAAFLALLIWLPLPVGSTRPWAISIMEVWVFLLTAVWLVRCFPHPARDQTPLIMALPVLGGLILIVIWVYIQTLTPPAGTLAISVDPRLTMGAVLRSLAYLLIFFLTLVLANSRRRIHALAYTIVYCGLFQAIWGASMTLSGQEWGFFTPKEYYLGKATGTFVNRNHLAGYLEMTLAVGIGLMISSLKHANGSATWNERFRGLAQVILSSKARLRIYLALMVVALVLTRSRMGNSAFFASLLLAGAGGLLLLRHKTQATVMLLASLLIIDLFIVGAWFGIDQVAQRLEQTTLASESRDEVNRDTVIMLREHPFVGTGADTFRITFPAFRGEGIRGFFAHAHNDYLQFATEFGLVGMIPLTGVVASCLLVALLAQRRRRDPLMQGIAFGSTMGITALLIHAGVDFNFQIPANAALFTVLLALPWIALHLRTRHVRKFAPREAPRPQAPST